MNIYIILNSLIQDAKGNADLDAVSTTMLQCGNRVLRAWLLPNVGHYANVK